MIDVFQIISKKPSIYVSISPSFLERIRSSIIKNYRSLRKFNREKIKINWSTFEYEFRKARYHLLSRLFKIGRILKISEKEILKNIRGFRVLGSRAKSDIILPHKIRINENFVEGYALYIAEGDTGLSGKKLPKKLRFTNSDLNVIRFFIQWLNSHFPGVDFYLNVILPPETRISENFVNGVEKELSLNGKRIKIKKDHYNKKVKYRVCADNAILVDLILSLDKKIKNICLKNKKLARAYIRGMMIGEGTAYFNKSRYVRIEMRNEKEIKYLHKLFRMLGFNCRPYLRSERENMWSIYIGAKQLKKFYNEIGFGVHQERQKILEAAVNKKLRVNQYV
jgi:hypothetical protein